MRGGKFDLSDVRFWNVLLRTQQRPTASRQWRVVCGRSRRWGASAQHGVLLFAPFLGNEFVERRLVAHKEQGRGRRGEVQDGAFGGHVHAGELAHPGDVDHAAGGGA
ncbi:hypothetical protein SDC9_104718 [bioreactor metagenome]|uniref:Uncharacterized protein n=1 Tax=bioreactor metagenome TaxID=1076179 RepID=A0A645B009_9ZZZZ